jgi:hypothetical protein
MLEKILQNRHTYIYIYIYISEHSFTKHRGMKAYRGRKGKLDSFYFTAHTLTLNG